MMGAIHILLTGYCEPDVAWRTFKRKPDQVKIFGKTFIVKAAIDEITSLSAHGDYDDMSQWLASQDPRDIKKLFLVHGEYEVQQKFREKLLKKGLCRCTDPGSSPGGRAEVIDPGTGFRVFIANTCASF